MNIAEILSQHAEVRPNHPAIEDGDRIISYRELNVRVTDAAARLQMAGIRPGDIVAVMLPDSAEHLILFWAIARTGAIVLSIEESLTESEKEAAVADLPVACVIGRPSGPAIGDLRREPIQNICSANRAAVDALTSFQPPTRGDDDPYSCSQSSGTTGRPKSFLFSHAQVSGWIARYTQNGGAMATDRYLVLIRMSFVYGRNLCFAAHHMGATVVIRPATTIKQMIDAVHRHGITVLSVTPAHLRGFLASSAEDLPVFPALRAMYVATAPSSADLRREARRKLTPNLFDFYGSNEIGFVVLAGPNEQDKRPDALGQVIADVEGEVVDEEGRPLPFGDVGLLRFRGPVLSDGYLNDAEATARAFRDGWFYPGDLASVSADGFVFLKGRADDIINNEGAKFYPIEVESVLRSHPAVAEAAVLAWPHPGHGEVAVAAVTTAAPVGGEELMRHCRERLAGYKVPDRIMFVREMPKNPMGKIVKARLKDMLREELGRDPS